MKPPPKGWPRISTTLFYEDRAGAIDWLTRAFGFDIRLKVEGDGGRGRIEHSELGYGEGPIMVGGTGKCTGGPDNAYQHAPSNLRGANTQVMCVHVDAVDAHCAQAENAGSKIVRALTTTDYGADYWTDRTYECVDPEGHHWYFMQRLSGTQ